jgi:hypothetical protein
MELTAAGTPRRRSLALPRPPATALAVAGWAGLIAACAIWGAALLERGTGLYIHAPPLYGTVNPHAGPGIIAALGTGAAIAWFGPALAVRLRWRPLLAVGALASAAWGAALALTAGPDSFASPLESPHEYLAVVPLIDSAGDFLATFTERVNDYPTHVRGHPPGMALIAFGLSELGLAGSLPISLLILAVGASTPVAVLIAARAVAGEVTARAAAPYLVLTPAAVWIVTSGDALFMGVAAWAVSLTTLSVLTTGRARTVGLSVAGGLAFALTCFLSFGLVLLAVIPAAVAIRERRFPRLAPGVIAVVAVMVGVAAATGYWWLDGLGTARREYYDGVASVRPFGYFAVANLAAFAIATGPATAAGLGRMRRGPLLPLVGGALAAVAIADLSAMSKAEVERIWLPFAPWVILAAAALPASVGGRRLWLAAQAALALAVQVVLVTAW